jgi:hypothetical protein
VAAYLIDRPELRTAAEFVAALADVPTRTFMRALLSDFTRDTEQKELVARAIDGDIEAQRALERSMPHHKKGLRALLGDPGATHQRMIRVLSAWAPIYGTIEPRIAAIGERDHRLRAADRASLADADLIETTTGASSATRSPTMHWTRWIHLRPHPPSCGSTARSATRPGCASSSSWPGATST